MKFMSEELRQEVEEVLEDRMTDAFMNDRDCVRSMIRHGQEGIEEMTDERLMEEYELWNGYSCEEYEDVEDIDDSTLKQMVIAKRNYEADQIILGGSDEENDDGVVGDQCADSYIGLHNDAD